MAEPILAVSGLVKRFGGVVATDNVHFDVTRGEIHAVIGPNGAGKTTFVAQIAGQLRPDAGRIVFAGEDVTRLSGPQRSQRGLARSFQITSVFRDLSALANVALAIQAHAGHSFRLWRRADRDAALVEPARAVLADVGLAARAHVKSGNLAHGEQRQLEIAMALATRPKLLLLDEPTAGMGAEDSERMTAFLATLKSRYAMLLIEHDMNAVFALADRITVLVYGRAIATGTPEAIRGNDAVRAAYLGDDMPDRVA
ncbi:MAG: ABC transporter ATP-binding protein [Alphaproteobacteria bacterium]|nr:ABC transporter ATP-binding protein [Alphaproteobacteria bacterium]